MELKLYDTLTKEKRVFAPLDPKSVRMYVCGPTVYDFAHIGNARPVIVFDVLYRLLRYLAGTGAWDEGRGETSVTYVRNITDVDDKINNRAAEEYPNLPLNEAIRQVTEKTEHQFHEDVDALGCLRPTFEPRATEFISRNDTPTDMVRLIGRLIANKHAYFAKGHVLFEVSSMSDYGNLSRRPLDEMIAGARVEVAPYKRNPMDFVLWKPSKEGEPAWPSPWGLGRPGWHIECSAMSAALLGETFDIHGGGIDLVFPHHENEIAQSRCAFHTPIMASFWMHNGFLQVEGQKMSKSLGNFITIRELLRGEARRPWPGEVIRLAMLATHYRLPIDFNEPKLQYWWTKICFWASRFEVYGTQTWTDEANIRPSKQVILALSDDLNFQEVIVYLDHLAQLATKQDSAAADELGRNLIWLGLMRRSHINAYETRTIGGARFDLLSKYANQIEFARAIVLNEYKFSKDLDQRRANLADVNQRINELDPNMRPDGVRLVADEHSIVSLEPIVEGAESDARKVQALIDARNNARKEKDFKEADRIRDELAAMGVVLKDSKDGTTWEIAR